MSRAVHGKVMFVGERNIVVRTEHRNKYHFLTNQSFTMGEDVWCCFSKLGLQEVIPFSLISEEEQPPPDCEPETSYTFLDLLGLW